MAKQKVSNKTAEDALAVAKGTARPGQTKEQTKLIAQGIEKGIAEFKKREKAKARERDKDRKKQQREQATANASDVTAMPPAAKASTVVRLMPWLLLVLSWLFFALYIVLQRAE